MNLKQTFKCQRTLRYLILILRMFKKIKLKAMPKVTILLNSLKVILFIFRSLSTYICFKTCLHKTTGKFKFLPFHGLFSSFLIKVDTRISLPGIVNRKNLNNKCTFPQYNTIRIYPIFSFWLQFNKLQYLIQNL